MPYKDIDADYRSVDGDVNAKAIFRDRHSPAALKWLEAALGVAFILCAIFYGSTGHPGWMAALVVTAVWVINGKINTGLHDTKTWLLVIERRCQLLEQDANEIYAKIDRQ